MNMYEKQGFENFVFDEEGNLVKAGTVVTAEHLEKIEDALIAIFNHIESLQHRLTLSDRTADKDYMLYVDNGKLTMAEVEALEGLEE